LNCRWEGHFAYDADLVKNGFVVRMDGCVWFGSSDRDGVVRPNIIRDNDFSQTDFTSNVAFRSDFPVANQLWPAEFVPLVDD
jgi:hypothetical protein